MPTRPARLARLLILSAVAIGTFATTASADPDLRIFYTSNVKGYIDQCGCRYNPSGGIERRATYFSQNDGVPAIKLDGGELVGDDSPIGRMQTAYLLRAMQEMGYRTIGVGPRDFMYGMDYLRKAERDFELTLTNLNVIDAATGEPVFEPWVIEDVQHGGILGVGRGTIRVGVVNVIGQDRPPLVLPNDIAVAVNEPVIATRAAVAELRDRTDVIVLMAYVNPADLEVLHGIDGVDVVVQTRTARVPGDYVVERGGVAMGHSTIQGRGVGRIDLRLEDGEARFVDGSMTMLNADVPDDEAMLSIKAEFERWRESYLEEHAGAEADSRPDQLEEGL